MNEMMSPSRSRADKISRRAAFKLAEAIMVLHKPVIRTANRMYRVNAGLKGYSTGYCYGYKLNGAACDCCPF